MGYLTNFIVYMLAMVGVLVVAMLVFKHTTISGNGKCSNGKCLKVLDTLSIGPRKTLYIVSAGEEKFLIAGDTERTSLISKLNPKNTCEEKFSAIMTSDTEDFSTKSFESGAKTVKQSYIDKSIVGLRSTQVAPHNSVMRSMVNKLNERNLEGSINE